MFFFMATAPFGVLVFRVMVRNYTTVERPLNIGSPSVSRLLRHLLRSAV